MITLKEITHSLISLFDEQITIENGYHYDMTGRVFHGKQNYNDESELPFISIMGFTGEFEQTSLNNTRINENTVISLESQLKPADINNPADAIVDMRQDLLDALTYASKTKINGTVKEFIFDKAEWGVLIPPFDNEPCLILIKAFIEHN